MNQFEITEKFIDLRITGMNERESGRANPDDEFFEIVLNLSAPAPREWANFFNQRWPGMGHQPQRRALAAGRTITIGCLPNEMPMLTEPLKTMVNQTNQAYRDFTARQEQKERDAEAQLKADIEQMKQLKQDIRFD